MHVHDARGHQWHGQPSVPLNPRITGPNIYIILLVYLPMVSAITESEIHAANEPAASPNHIQRPGSKLSSLAPDLDAADLSNGAGSPLSQEEDSHAWDAVAEN